MMSIGKRGSSATESVVNTSLNPLPKCPCASSAPPCLSGSATSSSAFGDKKQHTDAQLILTGFNTASHDTVSRFDEYEIKKTVGGINLFFHRSLYHKIVRPELRDINWDHALSEKIASVNGSVVAVVPSVVQHIGESGLWSRPGEFDVSVDFIE